MSRFSRFAGALITGSLVVGGVWYCRPGTSNGPSGTATEAPRRGGQLVTTVRAEPRSFNRITVRTQSADLLSVLTQARLVRVNRSTFELEPWLAERWESSPDGLTHTLYLRDGLKWSDGTPLTAEDVAFSFRAATDQKVSVLASTLLAGGKPMTATVVDPRTVRVQFAGPSGPGLRMLDALPIVPRHKLEAAYMSGKFAEAWSMQSPPAEVVGLGPFVFAS
jgi:peptide/nickel transport system substrate-binding protein